jgi:predicted ATPase/DNA-binding SARP family transcriptional activator
MAHLSLKLLGPMQMTLDGQSVNCKYDKVRALLAYLATEAERPHRREALLGLLWPDLPQVAARNNLRQVLATLRDALGDQMATPPFLLADRVEVQFNPGADFSLDVVVFADLFAACAKHAHRRLENCKACAERFQQMAALYQGPFLTQFFLPDSDAFEAWAVIKREQLHQLMLTALAQLVIYHERRGHYDEALTYARRQLELEPWLEEAHRQLMRLFLLNGERSAALEQYATCRRILATELGVEPERATTALYNQIRATGEQMPLMLASLAGPATTRPHTLPPQPTPFVGRASELAELGEMLANPACRLVTLVGPGGIGKSRLAIQAAAEQLGDFTDGIYIVPLAGLGAAELLADAICNALQLESSATADSNAYLLAGLRDKELLLILDNFEHLLPPANEQSGGSATAGEAVELVTMILQQAREVTLLVTSRERLNLHGEWVFVVDGLALPDPLVHVTVQLPELAANDAIQLFVQSARRVQRDFALTAKNGPSILRICQLTAGLPLAIELAAGWVRLLSCAEIAEEIERSIGFLTTNVRDLPERHRSLTAVFTHSWQLLTPEEQSVLRRLAVCCGAFSREAAEQIASASLPILANLVDKSLLARQPAGRYALHPLVRQYAAEQLQAVGETAETNNRHLEFFKAMAEIAETQLNGPEQTRWLDRLEAENENLRAALTWTLHDGDTEAGVHLAVALYPFWYWRNYFGEGRTWLRRVLAKSDREQRPVTERRARALWASGVLAEMQNDHGEAAAFYQQSLVQRRALDDKAGLAASLNSLGALYYREQAYAQAESLFAESLALRRSLGQTTSLSIPLNNLALTALVQGDPVRAQKLFEEALALNRETDNKAAISMALYNLGTVMLAMDDPRQAQIHFDESLALQQEVMDKDTIAGCLEGVAAALTMQRDDPETALRVVRLLGAAETMRQEIGAPILVVMKRFYERAIARVQAILDEEGVAAMRAAGQDLSTEQAIVAARALTLGD